MMIDTAPVTFTLDELWFLQSFVRHEIPQPPEWKFPPASLDLNDAIADAILGCTAFDMKEATLQLRRGDLLLLDYLVPQAATNVAGKNIGRPILLKTYRARRELAEGTSSPDIEPDEHAANARLERWREAGMPMHPRRSRKLHKEE